MNPTIKHVAERVIVGSGAAALARHRLCGRTLVLAYHNVLADGRPLTGDQSLHLRRSDFARQLDALAASHDVVPIESLAAESAFNRSRVVITFDDAYSGALNSGVDEVVKRGLPATIFVAPGLLGAVPWWDILAERSGGALPEDSRQHALRALGGRSDLILGASQPHARSGVTKLEHIGSEGELASAAMRPGITLGSHTWSHPNLSELTHTDLELELARSLQWLRQRFANVVPWLTYPYGLFNETVQTVAERCGYRGAFRIHGGWIGGPRPAFAIPRLNIPSGLSIDGFRLKLAGL